jgi:hypothetical protein
MATLQLSDKMATCNLEISWQKEEYGLSR